MVAPSASIATRTRPYKRFLTSAFHRRFVHASALALLVCWNNAFWIANTGSYLWSWFPLGPTGFKALLLFFSSLAVFILQVATLQIGARTKFSPFASFRSSIFSFSTAQVLCWYTFSAWWFSEVYIWSAPEHSKLTWVNHGDMSTPDRLNERPIYLRCVYLLLALVQSCNHIYNDFSGIHIPVAPSSTPSMPDGRTHRLKSFIAQLQDAFMPIISRCILISLSVSLAGPFVYTLFLRQFFWSWHLTFAKLYFSLPRSDVRPVGYPPSNPFLMLRSFLSGFLLVLLWEATAFFFSSLFIQEPTKKDFPLSVGSQDPNGTLLNGLKAKKDVVKTFAFWELAMIARRFPERRRAIFADIERKEGPCWSQMLESALGVVRGVSSRIVGDETKASRPATAQNKATASDVGKTSSLPRLLPDINKQPIFIHSPPPRTRGQKFESTLGPVMRSLPQSPEPWSPPISRVKGLLEYMTPAEVSNEMSTNSFGRWLAELKAGPVGWIFRTSPQQKINALVLGNPRGNAAIIVDAIESVTRMSVASLSEDIYGKAVAHVPDTVRSFTEAVLVIEQLIESEGEGLDDAVEEVEIVLERLKAGLNELLSAFQLYLADVGLGVGELRAAKNAAEKKKVTSRAPGIAEHGERGRDSAKAMSTLQEEKSGREKQTTPKPQPRAQDPGKGRQKETANGPKPSSKRSEAPAASRRDGGGLFNSNAIPNVRREMEMAR